MWYQWIFYDEETCLFRFFEGSNLYDVNKSAFEHYMEYVDYFSEFDGYEQYVEDTNPDAYIRHTLYDFVTDRPTYIVNPYGPYTDIEFHKIDLGEHR